MSENVELIPMFCPKCQNAIPAGVQETAWVCGQCGQGMLLSDVKGVIPFPIHFAAGLPAGKAGRPFWVVNGRASLQRSTYRGNQAAEMVSFWKEPRRFFVPAYELPLDQIIEIGAALLQSAPPQPQEGSPAPFLPVVVTREDIHALAEFIVMGVEASRKDNLKELKIELDLEDPQLWVLP
jgi:ribosomal protein S27AE